MTAPQTMDTVARVTGDVTLHVSYLTLNVRRWRGDKGSQAGDHCRVCALTPESVKPQTILKETLGNVSAAFIATQSSNPNPNQVGKMKRKCTAFI